MEKQQRIDREVPHLDVALLDLKLQLIPMIQLFTMIGNASPQLDLC